MIITIQKTVFGGDGLAFSEGKAVFVEGALPGETVEARVTEQKKSFWRAKAHKIIESSPDRVKPPCEHAAHCGGCQYQHVSYEGELRLKQAQMEEVFSAWPGALGPMVPSTQEWAYRSSVTLHPVTQRSSRNAAGSVRLGLIAQDGCTVIPIKKCLLADPAFLPVFAEPIRARRCPERVTFKLDESGRIVDDLKESFLRMRLGAETYLVHSSGFFQTHPGVASLMLERVRDEVRSLAPQVLFDLYAGVGTFGLAAAPDCGSVVFIEESPAALQALKMNVAERKLTASIYAGRVESRLAEAWSAHRPQDPARAAIVLDPPRAGLAPSLAAKLADLEAGLIVYISCDPITLQRDLKRLCGGRWKVVSIQPYDMFPKTKHLELLTILKSHR